MLGVEPFEQILRWPYFAFNIEQVFDEVFVRRFGKLFPIHPQITRVLSELSARGRIASLLIY
jgi:hypothetical protein